MFVHHQVPLVHFEKLCVICAPLAIAEIRQEHILITYMLIFLRRGLTL